MAGRLTTAFWNVENLFESQTHPPKDGKGGRGPQSAPELTRKVQRLAECINRFFATRGPDLLALAEVHTENILIDLESKLASRYGYVWEPAGRTTETGLAVLVRKSLLGSIDKLAVQRPAQMSNARPRCMIVQCDIKGCSEPFVVAVNHWRSLVVHKDEAQAPVPPAPVIDARSGPNDLDRRESADWLGNWLAITCPTRSAVVIGDFNAEPPEYYFGKGWLRSSRRFGSALSRQTRPTYLYNAAWKFLTEPLLWEHTMRSGGGNRDTRPKRTLAAACHVWDQLMVSGAALTAKPLRLLEGTIHYHCDADNSKWDGTGAMVPVRWHYTDNTTFGGASDHYPLLAEFEVA